MRNQWRPWSVRLRSGTLTILITWLILTVGMAGCTGSGQPPDEANAGEGTAEGDMAARPGVSEDPSQTAAPGIASPDGDTTVGMIDLQRLDACFEGTVGAFVLYDTATDRFIRHNEPRCSERFTPCSTFKIPNALIALDTGVAEDSEFVIRYDPQRDPPQEWWTGKFFGEWPRDHDLRSAMKYSVVWYYREVARRIGAERMQTYLDRFDYGNHDISGGIDLFWLQSSLTISADEQVGFLRRLYHDELGCSERATAMVKDIIVRERTAEYTFSGKTGSGQLPGGEKIGWLVGYVEKGGNVWFYALNIEADDYKTILSKRVGITRAALEALEILPQTSGDDDA